MRKKDSRSMNADLGQFSFMPNTEMTNAFFAVRKMYEKYEGEKVMCFCEY